LVICVNESHEGPRIHQDHREPRRLFSRAVN
jgi:hypothetical protein